jgi:hypothetical protein
MTIQEFAQKIQEAEQASLVKAGLDCEANMNNAKTQIKLGRKWTRVDVGYSGKYMINPEGDIYGIKAYGVPHLGHYYGNLNKPETVIIRGRY